ncbi:MAG: hypothetical protein QM790_14200 [Nibricoccus sp.]
MGVLLATELLWPPVGDVLAPLTYGRWVPLHLDWQLYGWCSLPLVGVLLCRFGDSSHVLQDRLGRLALWAWSVALLAGGVSWLAGVNSGKLFLEWYGWGRPLLPTAMTLLWLALSWQFWVNKSRLSRRDQFLQAAILLLLFFVPGAVFWASGRGVYPSVNPHSGGATGASLLASTLGIIAIYGLVPLLLNQPVRSSPDFKILQRTYWGAFACCAVVYAFIDHGNATSAGTGQQIGLGVLVAWIPLSWQYFRAFAWPQAARLWLCAAFAWWTLLVISGFVFFLPGISEHLKFTNGLVAHAHLSLAGLVSCFNLAILNALEPQRPLIRGFWAWQIALVCHVVALVWIGWQEGSAPAGLFLSWGFSQVGYGVRLLAGATMLLVSFRWLMNDRCTERPDPHIPPLPSTRP